SDERCDGDDRQPPDGVHDPGELADKCLRGGTVHADERLDVHSRTERRLPGAREDETRDVRIEIHDDVPKPRQVLSVQHVQLVRTVKGDPHIGSATIDCDVSHVFSVPQPSRRGRNRLVGDQATIDARRLRNGIEGSCNGRTSGPPNTWPIRSGQSTAFRRASTPRRAVEMRESVPPRPAWTIADEGWGRKAADFAALTEPYHCREYVTVHHRLGVDDGDRLLDVACGSGLAIQLTHPRGAVCAGIDASQRLVAVARDRNPTADIRVGDMHALPWDDAAFDVVTSFRGVWGTTADVVGEIRRVLVPGGRIGLT